MIHKEGKRKEKWGRRNRGRNKYIPRLMVAMFNPLII